MSVTTLVVYASKHGATKEIAEQIARTLRENGIQEVKCLATDDAVPHLPTAKTVILGVPIYATKWFSKGSVFVESNRLELNRPELYVFTVGLAPEMPQDIADGVAGYEPKEQVYFRGALSKNDLNLVEKLLIKLAKGIYGDFRDWDKINAWATSLAPRIR